MKTFKIIVTGLMVIFAFSCSPNKQSQLNILYRKQKALNEKIKKLEAELNGKKADSTLNNSTLVGASDVILSEFNHFIEIP